MNSDIPNPDGVKTKRRRRRWPRVLAWFMLGVLAMLLSAYLLIQSPWGARKISRIAEEQIAAALPGSSAHIGTLAGNLLTRVSARDVRLYAGDSLVVSIGRVGVRYNIFSLLFGEIDLRSLRIEDPHVIARMRPDSTWDILSILPEPEPSAEAKEPTSISIARISVIDGIAEARIPASRDSIVTIGGINAQVSHLRLGEDIEIRRLAVEAVGQAPSLASPLKLDLMADLGARHFTCERCTLTSSRSHVLIDGYVDYSKDVETPGADLSVSVDSLALADLHPFVPILEENDVLTGHAKLRGSLDSMVVETALESDHSRLGLNGTYIRRDTAVVFIDADLLNVDPAHLWIGSPLKGSLTGTLRVDLRGSRLADANGKAALRIHDSTLNRMTLANSQIDATLRHGIALISGNLEMPALHIDIGGSVNPLADTVAWSIEGRIKSTGFDRVYPYTDGLHAFSISYDAEGSTASAADYFRNLSIDVQHLEYADLATDSTRVTARMRSGVVHVDAGGRLSAQVSGREITRFALDGQARFGENVDLDLKRLDFRSLDISPWTGQDSTASMLDGNVTGRFTIPPKGQPSGKVSGVVSGVVNAIAVDSAAVSGRLSDNRFVFDAFALSGLSTIALAGDARLADTGLPVTARGSYDHLDMSLFSADSTMRSDLYGELSLRSRWVSMTDHSLHLETEFGPSSWNDQQILSGRLEVESRGGSIELGAEMKTPQGGFEVTGSGILTDSSFTANRLDGTFASLRLGDLLGLDRLSTDLNGQMHLTREGDKTRGNIKLDRSAINRSTVRGGDVILAMVGDSLSVDGDVAFDMGRVKVRADGLLGEDRVSLESMFSVDSLDVAALAGMDSVASQVNLGCSIVGTIATVSDSDVAGLCLAANSRLGTARVDSARLNLRLRSGALSLQTVKIRSNVANVDGAGTAYLGRPDTSGAAPAVSDLKVAIDLKDLTPLEVPLGIKRLEGEGTVDLSITGRPERPDILVEPHLAFLTYNDIRISSVDGYMQADGTDFSSVDAVVDMGFSVFSGFPVQRVSMSLQADQDAVIFVTDVVQNTGRRGTLSATYDRSGEEPELRIDDLTLNLAGTIWRLNQEAVVTMGDVWEVHQFLIFQKDGQIALDGEIDPDGEQNLILTAEHVETSAFIDLFGIEDVAGALEGYLVLGGPANNLTAESSMRIRDLKTLGTVVGDLTLETNFENGRMSIDGRLAHVSGRDASIKGSVPLSLSLGGESVVNESNPIDLAVSADSLPVHWVLPFLDKSLVSDIGGILVAEFGISGDWTNPELSGDGTITDGSVRLTEFNTEVTEIKGAFSLRDDVLTIKNLDATSREVSVGIPSLKRQGYIKGSGNVNFETLSDLGLDLAVEFKNFRAIATETYQATVSGTADVSGSMRAPVVSADVSISPADFYMTEELLADETEGIALTDRDIRILERRFGYRIASEDTTTSDFVDALKLDARVNIDHDVWLRSTSNPTMDIEFSGNVVVRKEPFQDQRIVGTINVNPARSRIVQFARRFGVERGTITFNGLIDDAVIEFRAQYVVPSRFGGSEVKILLDVTGIMSDLQLEISSQPQMDDATIASYLLTGRPPGEAGSTGAQAAEIAIGGVSRMVESFASENFGLDVVEIEASGTQGTRLTVGKYVSPKTYVYVQQPLTASTGTNDSNGSRSTQIGLEYELFSWLVTEVSSRHGSFRGNLRWQISY